MATTYEKMKALGDELRDTAVDDAAEDTRQLVELVQIAAGLGIDVFDWILPDPAGADVFIDKLIALLLRVRGDDLPPFDPNLYGDINDDDDRDAVPSIAQVDLDEEAAAADAVVDELPGRRIE